MTELDNSKEVAQKFMAAVFSAGVSGCDCKACVLLRELGKDFTTPGKKVKITKVKRV